MEQYNVLRPIGKGSYGEVWLTQSKIDRKKYVVKKMSLKNISKREYKSAQLEVKLLASLHHPNIVLYKESFIDPGSCIFIVMSFCEGGDMYRFIRARQGVPIERNLVIEWFLQITMALQHIHERNILHRDLKTQNIFLTKSKIIKLGDFGIARVLDTTCQMATTLIGTPYYMSPEIFTNKPYNHKSDVWALGCCLYEMISLKHAFNARDMNSLMYKILKGKPPPMPKDCHPDLLSLMKSMLSHEPDQRPSVQAILNHAFIRKNIASLLNETAESLKVPENQIKGLGRLKNCQVNGQPHEGLEKSVPENKKESETSEHNLPHRRKTDILSPASGDLGPKAQVQSTKLDHEKALAISKSDAKVKKPKPSIIKDNRQISVANENLTPLPLIPKVNHNFASAPGHNIKISNSSAEPISKSVARVRRRQKVMDLKSNVACVEGQKVAMESQNLTKISEESCNEKPAKSKNCKSNEVSSPRPLPPLPKNLARDEEENQKIYVQSVVDLLTKVKRSGSEGTIIIGNSKEIGHNFQKQRQCNESARQRRRENKKLEIAADSRPKSAPVSNTNGGSKILADNDDKSSSEMIELITALNHTLNLPDKRTVDKKETEDEDVLDVSVRIESRTRTLRKDCLDGVGTTILNEAFTILDSKENEVQQQESLMALLGDKFDEFIGKIWQLKFCEHVLIQN